MHKSALRLLWETFNFWNFSGDMTLDPITVYSCTNQSILNKSLHLLQGVKKRQSRIFIQVGEHIKVIELGQIVCHRYTVNGSLNYYVNYGFHLVHIYLKGVVMVCKTRPCMSQMTFTSLISDVCFYHVLFKLQSYI